jgi:hypothetical protein
MRGGGRAVAGRFVLAAAIAGYPLKRIPLEFYS